MTLNDLIDGPGIAFVSTPYTSYWAGLECAARDASLAAAALRRMGVSVYCPIAHGHTLSRHGRLDPTDAQMWMANDRPIFTMARALVVIRLRGWRHSLGVGEEIAAAVEMGKPIIYVLPSEIGLARELDDREAA
jgi:hypothetical protein